MDKYALKAKQIIEENIYCTIASASTKGEPWISPVFFAYDQDYNIYWVSNKDAKHSQLIRSNPQIAIVIFNSQAAEGKGDGVYVEAEPQELVNEEDIKKAIEALNKRVTKDQFRVKRLQDVTKDGVWRIYKATPKRITKLTEGEYINGQYVDTRKKVDLLTK